MKRVLSLPILLISIGISFNPIVTNAQNYQWTYNIGGTKVDNAKGMDIGNSGDIYICGTFNQTANFNSNSSTTQLVSNNNFNVDGFFAKYNPFGDLLWARQVSGTQHVMINDIAVDSEENVYLIGNFSDTAWFDIANAQYGYSPGWRTVFYAKYDSSGSLQWYNVLESPAFGSGVSSFGLAIEVDDSANIYLGGTFASTVDFNPTDTGVYELTSNGYMDIFYAKYNTQGQIIWARNIGGSTDEELNDLELDKDGNVYLCGWICNSADFDPGVGTVYLNVVPCGGIFVARYDTMGYYSWATAYGGGGYIDEARGMAVDANGDVYVVGDFQGEIDVDPGPNDVILDAEHGAYTGKDLLLVKYTKEGSYVWSEQVGSARAVYANDVVLDSQGNLFVTGLFSMTTYFDPDSVASPLQANSNSDLYIVKYDTSGNYISAICGTAAGTAAGVRIKTDQYDNLYSVGNFYGTIEFEQGFGYPLITSTGQTDVYINKYATNSTYYIPENVSICDGETYVFPDGTTSAVPTVNTSNLLTTAGLDSIIVTTLTVNSVNLSVVVFGNTINSNASGASYQWIDCNSSSLIPGENSQTFVPNGSGLYSVEVTQNNLIL